MKANREHSFDHELACIVGLEKSIILKNISFWVAENERRGQKKYFENGTWWTEESLTSLAKKYPYMKRASIGRWINELHNSGWILMVGSSGGKNRYSTSKVFQLWDAGLDWQSELSQNWIVLDRLKMRHQPSQNETPTVSKWDGDRLKMRHNNIDNNIVLNVDNNSTSAKPPKADHPAVIHQMVSAFEKEHQRHFKDAAGQWIGFTWKPKEFGALRDLKAEFIKRLKGRGADFSDGSVLQSWEMFLQMSAKADPWILKNQFTPSKLWGDFQGIIQKIQGQNGKQQPTNKPSKAEKQRDAMANFIRDVQQNGATGKSRASDMFRD